MPTDSSHDVRDRSFRFGCAVAKLALALSPKPGVRCLVDQLLKAGTAIGANLEEAKAGSSKREFIRYVEIALREARETSYWLRICGALELVSTEELHALTAEADQISRILGAIVVSAKRRLATGYSVFAFCILTFALLMS
jgi:four helix bundle protein